MTGVFGLSEESLVVAVPFSSEQISGFGGVVGLLLCLFWVVVVGGGVEEEEDVYYRECECRRGLPTSALLSLPFLLPGLFPPL